MQTDGGLACSEERWCGGRQVTIAPTVCGKNLEALGANLQRTLGRTFGNELDPWVAGLAHER